MDSCNAGHSRISRWLMICGVIFGVSLLSNAVQADETKEDTTKGHGVIKIDEPEFDFGYIPQEGEFVHNFVVTNVGDGVLNIVKVDPTCGCTTAPIDKSSLEPGDTTLIRVTFDSGKIIGKSRKRIKVLSDDPVQGISEVYITAWVARQPPQVTISGPEAEFTSLDVTNRVLNIKNMTDKKLVISTLPLPDEYFTASLSREFIPAGEEVNLTITRANSLPLGKFATSLTVEIGPEEPERFSIPITGIGYLE